MATETTIGHIEQLVDGILAEEPEYFRVQVKIKPTNNIKVYIDGDNGITIEKCVRFNRRLYKLIEESTIFPEGDFSLELSSPGVDEPLKMKRQYAKNIGRFIEIVFILLNGITNCCVIALLPLPEVASIIISSSAISSSFPSLMLPSLKTISIKRPMFLAY